MATYSQTLHFQLKILIKTTFLAYHRQTTEVLKETAYSLVKQIIL